jgi:hypothetical protein
LCDGAFNPNFPVYPVDPVGPPEPKPPTNTTIPEVPEDHITHTCVEGSRDIFKASYYGNAIVDAKVGPESLADATEYSVGLWFRYLTRFPTVMTSGKTDPFYNLVRLATR